MQAPQIDNCASGLRFGLLDVEPFEETKIVKRLGVRYREIIRGLKPTESFNDFITFNTHAVLRVFRMPAGFDQDKLAELITARRIKDYEADTEFKKVVERIEKTKGRTSVALKGLVQFFLDRRKAKLDEMFQAYAAMFLNSDFPMSLITDFTDFEATNTAALEFIAAVVRRYSTIMSLPELRSNFEKYRRAFDKMKFALSSVIDQMEVASFREQAMRWYLLISNAKDSNSIFEIESLSISRTDEQELKRLQWEFKKESASLRKLVMQVNVDYFRPLTEESELKSMFGEMVIALTS